MLANNQQEEEEVEVVDPPEEVKEEKKDFVDNWCLLESMEDFCSYEVDQLELFNEYYDPSLSKTPQKYCACFNNMSNLFTKEINIIVSILTVLWGAFYIFKSESKSLGSVMGKTGNVFISLIFMFYIN